MTFAHDGAIIFNLLIAGVLTFILGAVALVMLQRAILRNMMRTGGHGFSPPADDRPRRMVMRTPYPRPVLTGRGWRAPEVRTG